MIADFIKNYGAFVFGFLGGICVNLQWLAHSTKGAVKFIIQIDGEKLK